VGVGTPGYTAPEVLQGEVAGTQADVFAMGVLAYRLFTGKRPFSGTVPEALVLDILQREPPPPSTVRPEVTERVSAAVMEALAKVPAERTSSARAFLERLHGSAGPVDASPVGRPPALATASPPGLEPTRTDRAEPTAERSRRWLRVAAVMAVVLMLGLATFFGLRALTRDEAPAAAAPRTVTPVKAPPATVARPPAPGRADPSPDAGEAAALERARAILRGAEVLLGEGQDTAQGRTSEEDKKGQKGRGKKKKSRGHE
jgi:hypothetical protein